MKDLKHLQQVSPSPFLKDKVMAMVKELNSDSPAPIKWIVAAAIIINLLVIAQYSINTNSTYNSEYEIFTTETIINY